jgi:hypothetical protein
MDTAWSVIQIGGACGFLLMGSWPESQETIWRRVFFLTMPTALLSFAVLT